MKPKFRNLPQSKSTANTRAVVQMQADFNKGLALHQKGQLAQAREVYEQVLKLLPKHFDALHLLGVIAVQTKNPSDAVKLFDKALEINTGYAAAYYNRGVALEDLKQYQAAIESYDRAIALKADYVEAHTNRGNALRNLGQPRVAVESHDRAIALKANYAEAHNNRGAALEDLKLHQAAVESYDNAIQFKADYAEAHTNRGNVLRDLKQFQAAIESHDRAIALRADYAEAYYNRGVALGDLKQNQLSIESYDKAIALRADYAEAHYNRGTALGNLRQYQAALESYDKAIQFKADYADAYNNRGAALADLKQYQAALESYGKAIALKADYASAHFNQSLGLLQTGNFALGWEKYEWRWKDTLKASVRNFTQPPWLGAEPLHGKTILLHSEQGLGDTLQFCRYAKLVNELGARVVLEVQEPLVGLLTNLAGVAELVAKGSALPAFDYHCPLLSLPLAFKTNLDNVPAASRYLAASPGKIAEWQARLGPKTKPRVGLVWSGSTVHKNDHNRSFFLSDLVKHLPDSIQYVSLQKDVRDVDQETLKLHPEILHLGDGLKDFGDTAALCELVDVVVSVDTSVAHLAGALGRPVWILLPFNPDWRWLLERNGSPWYPCAKLYRQEKIGDWATVFEGLSAGLGQFLPDTKPGSQTD